MSNAPRITERPDDAFSAPARPSRVKTWRRGGARPPGLAEAAAEFLPKPWVDLGAQRINAQDIEDVARFAGPDIGSPLAAPANRVLKRAADLVIGAAALVLLAPLMGLIWALLRIEGGPALYVQSRVGQGGARFRCLKFRTMRPDAEARLAEVLAACPAARAEWRRCQKLSDDPRITPVGRLLRRSSLDELPQLLNVLRGEMSLVGPRPIIAPEVPGYAGDRAYFASPDFRDYARCRPGITGLWQVAARHRQSYDQRIRLDRRYVRGWSFWLDLTILWRTLGVVFRRTGA